MKMIGQLLMLIGLSSIGWGQNTYKDLPVIKADSNLADYRIDGELFRGNWRIAPEISPDILRINCYTGKSSVLFYTDIDSISYTLEAGKSYQFYVLLNEKNFALIELKGLRCDKLMFDETKRTSNYKFLYADSSGNEYLKNLREKYGLLTLTKNAKSDIEKVGLILNWAHNQWEHNGNNEPKKRDALSILEEAKEGKCFRCVEYAIVVTACLNSLELKSRVLALKTKDVETTQSGAGHVVSEVFLNDLQKWVMIDGQWDAIPFLKGVPLNAVEFQNAIESNYEDLEVKSLSGTQRSDYVNWVFPYLFYFDVSFDNREGIVKQETIDGKSKLMLVPLNTKEPTVFQINHKIDYCKYTNSIADFYAKP